MRNICWWSRPDVGANAGISKWKRIEGVQGADPLVKSKVNTSWFSFLIFRLCSCFANPFLVSILHYFSSWLKTLISPPLELFFFSLHNPVAEARGVVRLWKLLRWAISLMQEAYRPARPKIPRSLYITMNKIRTLIAGCWKYCTPQILLGMKLGKTFNFIRRGL